MDGAGVQPLGKRAAKAAETRQRLMDTARDAFEHFGYAEVTFRRLADVAGVSTGAYFGHFNDKADLFQAAMGRPAPDPVAFCERVAARLTGTEYADLAADALELRTQLVGGG